MFRGKNTKINFINQQTTRKTMALTEKQKFELKKLMKELGSYRG